VSNASTSPPRAAKSPRCSTTFAALAIAVTVVACSAPPTQKDPWQRVDLSSLRYEVEAAAGPGSAVELRQAPRGPRRPVPGRPWGPPEVVTLRQRIPSRVTWNVDLGAEPYLRLIPLGVQRPACRGEQLVTVRDASDERSELLREPLRRGGLFAPAERVLDLSRWEGQSIELTLEVVAAAGDEPARRWQPCRGIWGDPAVFARRATPSRPPPRSRRPNVVLIGLDTFRADHWTSRRDHLPSLTPVLDQLATESDVWLHAYSTFNNTNPSFISIHTGLYGRSHGIYDLVTPLPDQHLTMAERFRAAGYDTAAVLSARHLLPPSSGLGQGFDQVDGPTHSVAAASLVVDRAIDWIARHPDPFFLWLHFFDPHTPTLPQEPYASGLRPAEPSGLAPVESWTEFRAPEPRELATVEHGGHPDLYAGEIAYLDHHIDRLLGYLDSHGLLATTFVVVVADHGESLGEHDLLHQHFGLYEPSVHVPLVVRWPDELVPYGLEPGANRGRRFEGLVQTIDLMPSLLRATEVADLATAGAATEGRDLWELSLGSGRWAGAGRAEVFTEHANREGAMVRTRRYKYIFMEENPLLEKGPYLFDVGADPEEVVNLAGRGLEIEQRLSSVLAAWRSGAVESVPPRRPSADEIESLRALGYVQ
jgi:arylsulfatase